MDLEIKEQFSIHELTSASSAALGKWNCLDLAFIYSCCHMSEIDVTTPLFWHCVLIQDCI